MKLVLFDIDGTLLRGSGQGKRSLLAAIDEHVDAAYERERAISGKTDLQFLHEVLGPFYPTEELERELIPRILRRYPEILQKTYDETRERENGAVRMLPGIPALLDAVAEAEANNQILPGLLTGNIEAGARIKLGVFGLMRYFRLGAYGHEGRFRRELPGVAAAKAKALIGREFAGEDIVILGDTENDVDCGRDLGARAIAVATGWSAYEALEREQPHFLFADFSDTSAVMDAILG